MAKPYEVGYRRPPAHTRFKPGMSGNPTGKRKRQPTLSETEAKIFFDEKHGLVQDGKVRTVNAMTGVLMVLMAKALKGDLRAIAHFLKRADAAAAATQRDKRPDPAAEQAELLHSAMWGLWEDFQKMKKSYEQEPQGDQYDENHNDNSR